MTHEGHRLSADEAQRALEEAAAACVTWLDTIEHPDCSTDLLQPYHRWVRLMRVAVAQATATVDG